MRAVIQRVSEASVSIDDTVKGEIQRGLLILLAVEEADTVDDGAWLAGKIARLRIFNDAEGLMNLSLQDVGGEALAISQFTLFASTKKGNRPSYIRSARPETAIPLYEGFVKQLETELGKPIATGEFGAMMRVSLINDGPVTICIDTKNKE
ncbi:MAG: D-tyrosyl-tRNA(Tyr) deacylase [Limisphaerales bacterium]|jgi:D-tyrosyl-tRNA(Tyr) deacylase